MKFQLFFQVLGFEKICIPTNTCISCTPHFFIFVLFFFFETGICKLEKEILSLHVPGDSSSNCYSESPVGEKNIVEGKHLLM